MYSPHLQPFASCEMHSQPRLLSKFVQDHWDPWPSCANIAGNHRTSSWRPDSCRGRRKCPSGQRNAQFDFKLSTKVSCAAFEEPDSGVQKSASMRRCPPKSFDRRMDIPHVWAKKQSQMVPIPVAIIIKSKKSSQPISHHLKHSSGRDHPSPPLEPTSKSQIASTSIARKKWPKAIGAGFPDVEIDWSKQRQTSKEKEKNSYYIGTYIPPPPYSSQKVHIQIPNFPSILVINSFLLSNLAHPKKQNRLNHQQPTTHEPLNRHNNSTTPSLEHQLPWAWDQNHRFGKRCSKVPPPRTKSSPCNHPTHLPRLATQMIDEENRSFFSWQIWEVGRIKEGRDCRITDEFRFCEFYDISVAVNKTWSQVRHVLSLKTTRSSCFVIRCLYFSRGETTSTIRRHSATMRIKDPPLTSLEDQLDHPRTGPRKCLRSMVIVFCPLGIGLWDPSQMAEIHGL